MNDRRVGGRGSWPNGISFSNPISALGYLLALHGRDQDRHAPGRVDRREHHQVLADPPADLLDRPRRQADLGPAEQAGQAVDDAHVGSPSLGGRCVR